MEAFEKVYVAMRLRVDEEGRVRPTAVEWEERVYPVDRVLDERMAPPAHVGAYLTRRYECLVSGRRKVFYLETQSNRWFVEKPL